VDERHDTPGNAPAPQPQGTGRSDLRDLARGRVSVMQTFGELSSLGLSFVIAIALGATGGWYLDKWTGLSPLFFILGVVLGLVAGIRTVYVTTRRYLK
jgi:ATP synthase protein I